MWLGGKIILLFGNEKKKGVIVLEYKCEVKSYIVYEWKCWASEGNTHKLEFQNFRLKCGVWFTYVVSQYPLVQISSLFTSSIAKQLI